MVMLLLVRSNLAAAKTVSILAMTSPGVGRGEDARMKILAPSRDAVLRILEIIIALPNSVIPNNTNNRMGRTKANSIMVCPFLSLRNNLFIINSISNSIRFDESNRYKKIVAVGFIRPHMLCAMSNAPVWESHRYIMTHPQRGERTFLHYLACYQVNKSSYTNGYAVRYLKALLEKPRSG